MADPLATFKQKKTLKSRYLDFQSRFLDKFLTRQDSQMSAHDIRRGRVLMALLIFGLIACSMMAAVRFASDGWEPTTLIVVAGSAAILAGLAAFIQTGNTRLSGDILILTVTCIIFLTAFTDGGLHSRVLTWLPGLPLVANFTSARVTAMRTTWLVLAGLLMLLFAHEVQWIIDVNPNDSLFGRLAAGFGSTLFVSAIAYAYEDSRRRADEEREALGQTRSDWVSMVSHELRTPLTSLYGGLKLVAEGKLDDQPDKQQALLRSAMRKAAA